MKEEAKAVQEVAKATGNAINAAREAGGFIAKYIAGPLEQGIGIFEDQLKYMRWERQIRLMQRAQLFLNQTGLQDPNRPVSMKLAIPIIQGASLEEDDFLQDRWAALLVNAANASFHGEVRRSYVSILEQLTSLDVRILDVIYSLPFEQSQSEAISTSGLPNYAEIPIKNKQEQNPGTQLPENIVISLGNLARLGCLRPGMTWTGREVFDMVTPTAVGKAFVEACRIHKA
jgi:hypothetical protein